MAKEVLTYLDALEKLKKYCAYQERCQMEVRKKAYSYGLSSEEAESVITDLIRENFLNEQRFAEAYVRGKYKFKRWGRKKLELELKSRQVTSYCIKKGMAQIEPAIYFSNLVHLTEKRLPLTKGKNQAIIKQKLFRHLLGKGYEGNLIEEVFNDLFE
jgi:regulatory protein